MKKKHYKLNPCRSGRTLLYEEDPDLVTCMICKTRLSEMIRQYGYIYTVECPRCRTYNMNHKIEAIERFDLNRVYYGCKGCHCIWSQEAEKFIAIDFNAYGWRYAREGMLKIIFLEEVK